MSWWGGSRHASWTPSPPPVARRVVLAAAVVAGMGIAAYGYAVVWTPLQRNYLVTYVRSALIWPTSGEFALLYVVDARGSRIALDEELVSVTSATGDTTFALAEDAVKAGATRLEWRQERYPHAVLHRFLRRWIYRDRTPLDLITPPLWTALVLFLGGVLEARIQGFVDARPTRDPYSPWDTRPPTRPIVIDHVEHPSRTPGSSLAVTHRPSPQGLVASPAPPAGLTRVSAAGSAAGRSAPPPTPPASWSDPFFQ